jgi:hypothetical protein
VSSVAHVTLLLGNDALTVKVPQAASSSSPGATSSSPKPAASSTAAKPKPIDAGCIN